MSANIDEQFVEFVVKALVSNPDAVQIDRTIDEKGVLLELSVDPEDLGRVIGKRGGTAQSIRTLLRALGTKNDARYNLKIVDTDGGSGASRPAPQRDASDDASSSDDGADTDMPVNEDTTAAEESADNPVEEAEPEAVENEQSDFAQKTRKELADLDDLDI